MTARCKVCLSDLKNGGICPVCGHDPGKDQEYEAEQDIKHVRGSPMKDKTGEMDLKTIPRTHPVKVDMEKVRTTLDEKEAEDEDDIELSPEDIEIDFNKIDTSTLFDEDFEDKKITSKMLPQRVVPKDRVRKERVFTEKPSEEALRQRDVYAVPDLRDGEVETSKGVAIRTKGSMVKKRGSSLVIFLALAIIFIIIISLWLFGFLDF